MPCNCGHPERGICCGEKEEVIVHPDQLFLMGEIRFQSNIIDQYLKEIQFLEAKVAFLEAQIEMRTKVVEGLHTSPLTLP